jgi:hypothetical protein
MSATLLAPTSLVARPAPSSAVRPSTAARWAGRVLSGTVAVGLAAGAAMGLSGAPAAVEGTVALGFAPHHLPIVALIEVACLVLYLVPRTAVLGAVLWTGYFGGAVATHLRLDQPLLSQTLVPVYVATVLWLGLYLRDARVRALVRGAR